MSGGQEAVVGIIALVYVLLVLESLWNQPKYKEQKERQSHINLMKEIEKHADDSNHG